MDISFCSSITTSNRVIWSRLVWIMVATKLVCFDGQARARTNEDQQSCCSQRGKDIMKQINVKLRTANETKFADGNDIDVCLVV